MRILYQLTSPMDKTFGPQEVARRQKVLQEYAGAGVAVAVEPTAKGPVAIESAHDAGLVVPELIRLGPAAEKRGFSAIAIGCYSDPGLDALRELLTIPVIGPGAASLHLAAQLGTRGVTLTIVFPRVPIGQIAFEPRAHALDRSQLLLPHARPRTHILGRFSSCDPPNTTCPTTAACTFCRPAKSVLPSTYPSLL